VLLCVYLSERLILIKHEQSRIFLQLLSFLAIVKIEDYRLKGSMIAKIATCSHSGRNVLNAVNNIFKKKFIILNIIFFKKILIYY
jgi:hypothetical protein